MLKHSLRSRRNTSCSSVNLFQNYRFKSFAVMQLSRSPMSMKIHVMFHRGVYLSHAVEPQPMVLPLLQMPLHQAQQRYYAPRFQRMLRNKSPGLHLKQWTLNSRANWQSDTSIIHLKNSNSLESQVPTAKQPPRISPVDCFVNPVSCAG